jgi:dCTP deaminase
MILTGKQIAAEVLNKRIIIDPFEPDRLNPNSYNVLLGRELKYYVEPELDMRGAHTTRQITIPDAGYTMEPDELYLGHTIERIGSDTFVPFIGGRSSTGRLGLFVHITAPLGDIGYIGQWTFQFRATKPVRVYPRQTIGQIFFVQAIGPVDTYKGKYQSGTGPQAYKPAELAYALIPSVRDPYREMAEAVASMPKNMLTDLKHDAECTLRHVAQHRPGASSLLDVGCGIGLLLQIAESIKSFTRIVGIDVSSSVLGAASKQLRHCLLIRDDFFSCTFGQERFNCISLLAFLHLFPKRSVEHILDKVVRLLTPDGIIVASTSLHSNGTEGWEEKALGNDAWRFRARYTQEEWENLIQSRFDVLEQWTSEEIMNINNPKKWITCIAKPKDTE